MSVLQGVNSLDEMAAYLPKMSLKAQGLLDKPTAPMLVIGGVLDTQVPISDNLSTAQQRGRAQGSLDKSQGRAFGKAGQCLARPGDFQRCDYPLAGENVERSGSGAIACKSTTTNAQPT